MKRLLTTFLIGGIFPLAVAVLGASPIKEPAAIVRETSEKLVKIINEEAEALRKDPAKRNRLVYEVLLPVIDFDAFAQLTLGHHWRTATSEQRAKFVKEFKGMLIRTYTKYLADYSGTSVTIHPQKGPQDDKRQTIYTVISQPGASPIPINYDFRFSKGSWKAYNVTVSGLSLVHLFRTDFNQEISESSLDGLIARLAKTNLNSEQRNAPAAKR